MTTRAYRCADFLVCRTPLLPVDTLLGWSADLEAAQSPSLDGGALAAALDRDRARLRERLAVIIARPEVDEALYVSSPSFHAAIAEWRARPTSERGQRVELALVRFLERMATRPTPFGLFAGFSFVRAVEGRDSTLRLEPLRSYRRCTRIGLGFVARAVDALAKDPGARGELAFEPNTSVVASGARGGRLSYAEVLPGLERAYSFSNVDASEPLAAVLARAMGGATRSELAMHLVSSVADVDHDEAEEFVDELIDNQLLVPSIAPTLTSAHPAHELQRALHGCAPAAKLRERLATANAEIAALNEEAIGDGVARYRRLETILDATTTTTEGVVQTDLRKPVTDATSFGRDLGDAALEGALLVQHLFQWPKDELRELRERFVALHEDRRIPLVELLDEERGGGCALRGARVPEGLERAAASHERPEPAPPLEWQPVHSLLLRHVAAAIERGAEEIHLTESDLDVLRRAGRTRPGPSGFAVQASWVDDGAEARRVFVHGVASPGAALLTARFGHGDPNLNEAVAKLLDAEAGARPDVITAELVFLPSGIASNIVGRPASGAHEIAYLAQSGAPPERRITLDDLDVSVEGDRVVLWSRRLGREVLPRLTSTHVSEIPTNPGPYRFLALLARQGFGFSHWDWGPLKTASFLPRVVTDRLVLAARTWRLSPADLAPLQDARGPQIFEAMQALRARLRLPRMVSLVDSDRLLAIDLDNVLSIEAAAARMTLDANVILREILWSDAVKGPEGTFSHEMIVSFVKDAPLAPPAATVSGSDARPASLPPPRPRPTSRFAPGSERLAIDLSVSARVGDELLASVLRPRLRALVADHAARSWFFERRGAPDPRVRLVLSGSPERLLGEALPALTSAVGEGLATEPRWQLLLATYERPVDAFGGIEGAELAETIAALDSEASLALADALSDAPASLKWKAALLSMASLVDDFARSTEERDAILHRLRPPPPRDGRTSPFEREVGVVHRRERRSLEAMLDGSAPVVSAIVTARSAALTEAVRESHALARRGRLAAGLVPFVIALVERSHDRLLAGADRSILSVFASLLARIHQSRAARS